MKGGTTNYLISCSQFQTPNSKIKWVAGWWGIKFTGDYVGFFCPKLVTVTDNKFIGPFKNKTELSAAITVYNKKED